MRNTVHSLHIFKQKKNEREQGKIIGFLPSLICVLKGARIQQLSPDASQSISLLLVGLSR